MPRQKTHEEYISELLEKGIDVEPIEDYKGMKTKIIHHCKKHNLDWLGTPESVLLGVGCKLCQQEKRHASQRMTHEEYLRALDEKGIEIVPLEEYINSTTPIMHHCNKHNIDWMSKPSNVLFGKGCKMCGKEKHHTGALTTEQYIQRLKDADINVLPLEEYKGMNTLINHKCIMHDYDWRTTPARVLNGKGCPLCSKEKRHLVRCRTHTEYVDEISAKGIDVVPLEDYVNSNTPINHLCLKHNIEWVTTPTRVLSGAGCPECHKEKFRQSRTRTNEQYLSDLKEVAPFIVPLEEYQMVDMPIMHLCTKHNIKWRTTPDNVLRGHGCRECGNDIIRQKATKSFDTYIEQLKDINPNIICVGSYVDTSTYALHRCLIDGHEWYAKPACILSGCGCPVCNESHGERRVKLWLDKHGIQYIEQKKFADCKDKRELPFDFYIPSLNAVIEYDGKQHYEPIEWFGGEDGFECRKRHDEIKTDYCISKNINILRIPYNKNVEEELDSFIYNEY